MRAVSAALALVVLLCAFLLGAHARPRREFGSQTGPVRLYTAAGNQPSDNNDCFVGTCPHDVTLPFMFGDVCDNTGNLVQGSSISFATTLGTTSLNLQALFYEFFVSATCPQSFRSIFGSQWESYTADMGTPVEFNFVEYGVSPSGPHRQCPHQPKSVCGAYPNGRLRMNFVFDSFCSSTCVVDPSPSASFSPVVGPPAPPPSVPPFVPPPPGPGFSPVAPSQIPNSPVPIPPPIGSGVLGPISQGGAQISPIPFDVTFPNPPPILLGTKSTVGAASALAASIMLSFISLLLCLLAF